MGLRGAACLGVGVTSLPQRDPHHFYTFRIIKYTIDHNALHASSRKITDHQCDAPLEQIRQVILVSKCITSVWRDLTHGDSSKIKLPKKYEIYSLFKTKATDFMDSLVNWVESSNEGKLLRPTNAKVFYYCINRNIHHQIQL